MHIKFHFYDTVNSIWTASTEDAFKFNKIPQENKFEATCNQMPFSVLVCPPNFLRLHTPPV